MSHRHVCQRPQDLRAWAEAFGAGGEVTDAPLLVEARHWAPVVSLDSEHRGGLALACPVRSSRFPVPAPPFLQ
jgi:hypothetical protein